MVDITFSYADLEFFLLILVRVTGFIFASPFFSMSNTPQRVKIGLSLFTAYLLFAALPHNEVIYQTVSGYAVIVMKEMITGILIGWGAQLCMSVVSFAGSIADMEVGLSMVSLMDPATKETATFSGILYQYVFFLILIISGMYRYLFGALADSFTLIPVNGAVFNTDSLAATVIRFMGDYIIIGFRICLPIFCVMLLLNCVLAILAKVAPQMNMFVVGLQLKLLIGLGIMLITVGMLPMAAEFIFSEMKEIVEAFVKAMMR